MNGHMPTTPVLASLIGQWRLLSFDSEVQETGERNAPWGEGPEGRLLILPNSYMMVVASASARQVPMTEAEKAAAFNQTIAYSGPIEIVGDQIQTKVDVSWSAAWKDTVQARYFRINGDELSLTSEWAPSPFDSSLIIRGILNWKRE